MSSRRYSKASSRIHKRNQLGNFFSFFLKIFLPLVVLFFLVILLRAEFIQIKKVVITGNQKVETKSIEKIASDFISGDYFFVIPRSNILFLDETKIVAKILENENRIENIDVNKKVNGNLEINISERVGEFLWCSENAECFLMNKNGLVFSRALDEEKLAKIIFKGSLSGNPIMQQFASPDLIKKYIDVVQILSKDNLVVESIFAELPDKSVFKTNLGNIFFNPEEDLNKAALNILVFIKDFQNKDPLVRFDYIDARFGNKIFYKLKLQN